MNIIFDINHPVDVNFFKNAIFKLDEDGHNIMIVFRKRGKLENILKYELGSFPITSLGIHKKGFIRKILSQLYRDIKIIPFFLRNKIDLVVSFGGMSAIAAKITRKPYLAFDDDFEYKIPFYHANWFSTKHIFPDYIEFSNSRTSKFHGFKELAYLHPTYLNISENVLKEYQVQHDNYVFIREIANVSLNYKNRIPIIDLIIKSIKEKGLKIILSLEDKSLEDKYVSDCIVLKEPVKDIWSLMYYSLFSISSGDSVARETAILGVPTIYTGGREMVVNNSLISVGVMYKASNIGSIENLINEFNLETKIGLRNKIAYLIKHEWEDTTKVIVKHIKDYI